MTDHQHHRPSDPRFPISHNHHHSNSRHDTYDTYDRPYDADPHASIQSNDSSQITELIGHYYKTSEDLSANTNPQRFSDYYRPSSMMAPQKDSGTQQAGGGLLSPCLPPEGDKDGSARDSNKHLSFIPADEEHITVVTPEPRSERPQGQGQGQGQGQDQTRKELPIRTASLNTSASLPSTGGVTGKPEPPRLATSPPNSTPSPSPRPATADAYPSPTTNSVAQELENIAAVRRMSLDLGGIDPDLHAFSSFESIPALAPTKSRRGRSADAHTTASSDGTSETTPDEDEETDPASLYWVPAAVHPELAPNAFRKFLNGRVEAMARRREEQEALKRQGSNASTKSSSSDLLGVGSGGLQRRKSLLSRQVEMGSGPETAASSAAAGVGVGKGGRLDALAENKEGESSEAAGRDQHDQQDKDKNKEPPFITSSTTAVASALEEDKPILPPAPPGFSLRRSTRTTYRKTSMSNGQARATPPRRGRARGRNLSGGGDGEAGEVNEGESGRLQRAATSGTVEEEAVGKARQRAAGGEVVSEADQGNEKEKEGTRSPSITPPAGGRTEAESFSAATPAQQQQAPAAQTYSAHSQQPEPTGQDAAAGQAQAPPQPQPQPQSMYAGANNSNNNNVRSISSPVQGNGFYASAVSSSSPSTTQPQARVSEDTGVSRSESSPAPGAAAGAAKSKRPPLVRSRDEVRSGSIGSVYSTDTVVEGGAGSGTPTSANANGTQGKKSDKKEGTWKSSWGWLRGNSGTEDKKEKKARSKEKEAQAQAQAQAQAHANRKSSSSEEAEEDEGKRRESIVLDRSEVKHDAEDVVASKDKDGGSGGGGGKKKSKDTGLFSSLFGSMRKHSNSHSHHNNSNNSESSSHSTGYFGHKKLTSKSSLSPLPDRGINHNRRRGSSTSKNRDGTNNTGGLAEDPDYDIVILRPDIDYPWTRFNLAEEREIYRLAHKKLSSQGRPLHAQVLLSNFMYSYLAKVQAANPHMGLPTSAAENSARKREQEALMAQQAAQQQELMQQQMQQQQYGGGDMSGDEEYGQQQGEQSQAQGGSAYQMQVAKHMAQWANMSASQYEEYERREIEAWENEQTETGVDGMGMGADAMAGGGNPVISWEDAYGYGEHYYEDYADELEEEERAEKEDALREMEAVGKPGKADAQAQKGPGAQGGR